jgi:hypothetical protein
VRNGKPYSLYRFIVILLCILLSEPAISQPLNAPSKSTEPDSTALYAFTGFRIEGARKTKQQIIHREFKIRPGDSVRLSDLQPILEASEQLLYNTNLFNTIRIVPQIEDNRAFNVLVEVTERWYIYPTPQFKLIDRNLNEWLTVYDGDLNRIIYGVKGTHYNLTGHADQLNLIFLSGYNRNYTLTYSIPYVNKAMTKGLSMFFTYSQNREFPLQTSFDNKLTPFRSTTFAREQFSGGLFYRHRKNFYRSHTSGIQYNSIQITDSVLSVTKGADYLGDGQTNTRFIDLSYQYQYNSTNNINYPTKGILFRAGIQKRGLEWQGGMNGLFLFMNHRQQFPHTKKTFSSLLLTGKTVLPFRQSYINRRAFGYGDYYLRGLEYYVIDAVASGMAQYTLHRQLVDWKIKNPLRMKSIPYIPIRIFGKLYGDAGYAHATDDNMTTLNNRFLYSGGTGIDILTLYDFKLSIEYSFNQFGENGLFLHTRGFF